MSVSEQRFKMLPQTQQPFMTSGGNHQGPVSAGGRANILYGGVRMPNPGPPNTRIVRMEDMMRVIPQSHWPGKQCIIQTIPGTGKYAINFTSNES